MKLNAPDVNCSHCKGTGARRRELRLVVNGKELSKPSHVTLHCGCLSAELKKLHEALGPNAVLQEWPWDKLRDLEIPKASDGPEPTKIGSPFPIVVKVPRIPVVDRIDNKPLPPQQIGPPAPAPEPEPEMPKKKVKKKKHP